MIFILTLFVLFLFFLFAPETVFLAAKTSLSLWAGTVVPSLLPFFILNRLLLTGGGIALFGKAMEKPIRFLLKLPGEAAFPLIAGYSCGVPVSATIIADLRKEKIISKSQGNRLLAFCANVSPAFLLSAVAISMLDAGYIGPWLAMIHYGSNLLLTFIAARVYNKEPAERNKHPNPKIPKGSMSELTTDAIYHSMRTVCFVGGTMLIFFIIIAFFETIGFVPLISKLLHLSQTTSAVVSELCCGFLEITTGTANTASAALPLHLKCTLISGILAFGGLSAAVQIKSTIRETDLSLRFYFFYKAIQAVFALSITAFFKLPEKTSAVFATISSATPDTVGSCPILYWCTAGWIMLLIFRRLYSEGHRRY